MNVGALRAVMLLSVVGVSCAHAPGHVTNPDETVRAASGTAAGAGDPLSAARPNGHFERCAFERQETAEGKRLFVTRGALPAFRLALGDSADWQMQCDEARPLFAVSEALGIKVEVSAVIPVHSTRQMREDAEARRLFAPYNSPSSKSALLEVSQTKWEYNAQADLLSATLAYRDGHPDREFPSERKLAVARWARLRVVGAPRTPAGEVARAVDTFSAEREAFDFVGQPTNWPFVVPSATTPFDSAVAELQRRLACGQDNDDSSCAALSRFVHAQPMARAESKPSIAMRERSARILKSPAPCTLHTDLTHERVVPLTEVSGTTRSPFL